MDNDNLPLYPSEYEKQVQIKMSTQKVQTVQPAPTQQVADALMQHGFQPQMHLLGPENTVTTCQFCRASIRTAVKYTTTSRTHIAAAHWSKFCCLCCIPYNSDSAKNTDHYCPNCERFLGTYYK